MRKESWTPFLGREVLIRSLILLGRASITSLIMTIHDERCCTCPSIIP